MADREPTGAEGRRSIDMSPDRPPLATPHSTHDLLLIAAAADRDVSPAMRAAAADQLAACPECMALAGDLSSVGKALSALPPVRPVPRDMRLTAGQAARLRRGALWRRLLGPFASEGSSFLRPLAATLTTLGLAGLLLTATPFGPGGTAILDQIGAPVSVPSAGAAAGQDAYGPTVAPVPGASSERAAQATDSKAPEFGTMSTPRAGESGGTAALASAAPPGPSARDEVDSLAESGGGPHLSPLTWVSAGLVLAGIGLLGVLFLARRLV